MILETLAAITLTFTLPSAGQHVWRDIDPDTGDSTTFVECSGGQAIHQLSTARLYFNPATGGGWRLVSEHGVTGREGQPDSFVVDNGPGGHYHVTATNPIGEGCTSPDIYVAGSVVTGIPGGTVGDPVVSTQTFDVQGRLVHRISRSGIYWLRTTTRAGHMTTKKVVYLK